LFLIFIIVLMGWLLYDHLEKELETVGIGDTVYVLEVQENDDIIIRQGLVESVAFSDGIKYYIVKIAYRYDLVEFDIITYRYDSVFKTEKSAIKKNGGITRMKKNEL
jgi:hypothetical protein